METTIDPTLQALAEKSLLDELTPKGAKFGVEQGAFVAMTPQGAVRALVGGKNYAESQFNRAVAAKRQPGSAFKPFVYLTALERGLTPETIREDKPIDVKGWKPENYTHEYFGAVSLTKALAMSLNTVSVRLTMEVGAQSVVRTAHRLGISSKLEPNASISLGTSEVSVMELVSAYVPFANGGVAVAPHVIERVRTAGGKLIYKARNPGLGRVIDDRHAAMMNQMMQETLTSGTARKAELGGFPAAGKTGTSQDFRDAWFVGYTGHLIAGVWLGNDDNSPTKKLTGGGMPVDIWSRFMKAAHQGLPAADLPGMAGRTVDPAPPSIPAPMPQSSAPLISMLAAAAGSARARRRHAASRAAHAACARASARARGRADPAAPAARGDARPRARRRRWRCVRRRFPRRPAPCSFRRPRVPRRLRLRHARRRLRSRRCSRRCSSRTCRARRPASARSRKRVCSTPPRTTTRVGTFFSNLFGQR